MVSSHILSLGIVSRNVQWPFSGFDEMCTWSLAMSRSLLINTCEWITGLSQS